MIDSFSLPKFKSEVKQYESFKESVKTWIKTNYEPAKTVEIGIYGLKHQFQKEVGYVTHGTLTIWLDKWGFRVEPWYRNSEGTYNHGVYAKKTKEGRKRRKKIYG